MSDVALGIEAARILKNLIVEAYEFAEAFDRAFARVQTISKAAQNDAEGMKKELLELTTKIPINALEATNALYQIVSAGYDGSEALKILEASANTATLTISDTSDVARVLTKIIGTYGLTANSAMDISDSFFKSIELGRISVAALGEDFTETIRTSAEYGININEVFAAISELSSQGLPLNDTILGISSTIKTLVAEFGSSAFESRNLAEAFQFAKEKAEESDIFYEKLYGTTSSYNSILGLTGNNLEAYSDKLAEVDKASGITQNKVSSLNETFDTQKQLLKNNINVVVSNTGDIFKELAMEVLPGVNEELQVLGDTSIPAYAKALSVLANTFNLPLLFGGPAFSAEQFSPDVVKNRREAERQKEEFKARAETLSDEELAHEVDNIRKSYTISLEEYKNLEDRKKRGYSYDEEKLKEAERRNFIFYTLLEEGEKRLFRAQQKRLDAGGASRKVDSIDLSNDSDLDSKLEIVDSVYIYDQIIQKIQEKRKLLLSASKEQQASIASEIAELVKEKELRERLADEALQNQRNEEPPQQLKPIAATSVSYNEAGVLQQKAASQFLEYYEGAFDDLEKYGYQSLVKIVDQTQGILDSAVKQKKDGKISYLVDIDVLNEEGEAVTKQVEITSEQYDKLEKRNEEFNKNLKQKNPFKDVSNSFGELKEAFKSGDDGDKAKALGKFDSSMKNAIGTVRELGGALGDIFGSDVEDQVNFLADMAEGATDLGVGIGKIASGDIVGGALQAVKGAAKIYKTLTAGTKQFQEDQKKWINEQIDLERKLNAVLNEQIRLRKESNVFISDNAKKALNASKAYLDAQKHYDELVWAKYKNNSSELGEEVDDPFAYRHPEVSQNNDDQFAYRHPGASQNNDDQFAYRHPEVIQDNDDRFAYRRATAIPVVSEQFNENPGSDEEALRGYLSGLQVKTGVKKKKFLGITVGSENVFGGLLENYPKLIDDAGKFNDEYAKTLLNMDALPEKTKQGLEGLIEYQTEMEAAQEAMNNAIASIAGSISSDLFSALSSAWDEGTDSFQAFKDTVDDGLEDILRQMIFNQIFNKNFDELQKNMEDSLGEGGDGVLLDDFTKFLDSSTDSMVAWNEANEELDQAAEAAGFDFGSSDQSSKSSGLTGAVRSELTEETAGILAGLFRKSSDDIRRQGELMIESNNTLTSIALNTGRTADNTGQTVTELKTVVTELMAINSNTKPAQTGRDMGV